MFFNDKILVGKNSDGEESCILPKMANRHGLITGASGSGKTITLKVLAESFSDAGVPVFMADVKGDLAGTSQLGEMNENVQSRVDNLKLEGFEPKSYPVRFWDFYGKHGHPVRAEVRQIGPEILSIMLGLSEAQEGNLAIAFKIAQDKGLDLINLDDLRAVLQYVGENREDFTTKYGNITPQSIGVIQRSLLTLENQGADKFFGEPALDINDFFQTESDGRGVINILHAVKLFESPDMYASFLLWLLTSLFAGTPEVGDLDKPKLVFFFDEAHLLFNGMPTYRLKRITQVVKLIRSHGIGLYFASQRPTDVPDEVMSQLGNRVQHTLRAYTPAEQKIVRASADSFRTNKKFDTAQAILELGTGEALVSFQDAKGAPTVVERVTILPPQSQMGVIDDMARQKIINCDSLTGKYEQQINSTSAYDKLMEEKAQVRAEDEVAIQSKQTNEITSPKPTSVKDLVFDPSKYANYQPKSITNSNEPDSVAEKISSLDGKTKTKNSSKKKTRADKFFDRAVSSAGTEIGHSVIKKIKKLF